MTTSTALTLWLFSGVLALMWFYVIAYNWTYRKRWHEAADYATTFVLGPASLVVLAGFTAVAGWKRWRSWRAAR